MAGRSVRTFAFAWWALLGLSCGTCGGEPSFGVDTVELRRVGAGFGLLVGEELVPDADHTVGRMRAAWAEAGADAVFGDVVDLGPVVVAGEVAVSSERGALLSPSRLTLTVRHAPATSGLIRSSRVHWVRGVGERTWRRDESSDEVGVEFRHVRSVGSRDGRWTLVVTFGRVGDRFDPHDWQRIDPDGAIEHSAVPRSVVPRGPLRSVIEASSSDRGARLVLTYVAGQVLEVGISDDGLVASRTVGKLSVDAIALPDDGTTTGWCVFQRADGRAGCGDSLAEAEATAAGAMSFWTREALEWPLQARDRRLLVPIVRTHMPSPVELVRADLRRGLAERIVAVPDAWSAYSIAPTESGALVAASRFDSVVLVHLGQSGPSEETVVYPSR